MRIILVTLSGDPAAAIAVLESRFPAAEILRYPRTALDNGSFPHRLSQLRKAKPAVFAVMTESLNWQFGQEALMLFGALAGARQSLVIDAHNGIRSASQVALLANYPVRISRNIIRGRAAIRKASAKLDELAGQVAAGRGIGKPLRKMSDAIEITYLRATPTAGTQPGGATSHINGVVTGLLELGVNVNFISNDDIAGLDTSQVSFKKISPDPAIMPRAAFDVFNGMRFAGLAAEAVLKHPPDFIYQRYSRFSWAGVEAGLRAEIPLFLEYNGSEVWIGKNWDRTEQLELLERCERLNLDAATRIFVISDVERRNLLKIGIPDEKIIVNPNGVDTNIFRPGIGGHAEREGLGVGPDEKLIGFVGTFGPWHGVLALADAIALIPKDANLRFLLIGDGSLQAEVEQRLKASGDLDRVIFAGIVSHERVPALLDACDILVSPHVRLADGSEFFGSPTKLFEYMAMGKGIVASRLGQIADVLADGETALLVEPGNSTELSTGLVKLARDRKLLSRLGDDARQDAIAKHTWQQNAANVINAFNELV